MIDWLITGHRSKLGQKYISSLIDMYYESELELLKQPIYKCIIQLCHVKRYYRAAQKTSTAASVGLPIISED